MLLCDEPTGALDISTGVVVLEALRGSTSSSDTTTVVITHNAAIAAMADRVIRLADGRIVASRERDTTKLRADGADRGDGSGLSPLNRKLVRDLGDARAGDGDRPGDRRRRRDVRDVSVELRVAARRHNGLLRTQRFADVFASLKRAPQRIADDIAAIPGVAAFETRAVATVTLDLAGLEEPATGRLMSIPVAAGRGSTNCSCGAAGDRAGRPDEVLASEGFVARTGFIPATHCRQSSTDDAAG